MLPAAAVVAVVAALGHTNPEADPVDGADVLLAGSRSASDARARARKTFHFSLLAASEPLQLLHQPQNTASESFNFSNLARAQTKEQRRRQRAELVLVHSTRLALSSLPETGPGEVESSTSPSRSLRRATQLSAASRGARRALEVNTRVGGCSGRARARLHLQLISGRKQRRLAPPTLLMLLLSQPDSWRPVRERRAQPSTQKPVCLCRELSAGRSIGPTGRRLEAPPADEQKERREDAAKELQQTSSSSTGGAG